MDSVEVKEGSTRLVVPSEDKLCSRNRVFDNPAMELGRDITVGLCRVLEPKSFCDLLAGSGARGLRVANESGVEVVLNDIRPEAVESIKRNAGINGVRVRVENKPAGVLLAGEKFDFIDVDPFGPPVEYVDSAMQSLRNLGFLGVCATDTSALSGTYPRACARKYDALSLRTDFYPELGLRILLGFIARSALRHGFGVKVLFSHSTMHYLRVYVQADGRGGVVRDTLEGVKLIQYCFKCLNRRYSGLNELESDCSCGERFKVAGPLWSGVFADEEVCGKLKGVLLEGLFNTKSRAVSLVDAVSAEQYVLAPYYDLHKLCSRMGKPAPKMKDVEAKLREGGFSFSRTHFTDVGFRTNAPHEDVREIISSF